MDTDRSDEGQFSTPRAGARQAGYSSASDNEGDGGQGYSSARSWTSDNEYGTPRNSGNLVSSDSEVDGFYSGREQDTGYGSQRDRGNRTVHMPFVAGGNVPYSGGSSYGYKSSDNGGYSSGGGGGYQQSHQSHHQQHGRGPPPQYHHHQQHNLSQEHQYINSTNNNYNHQPGPPQGSYNGGNYDYNHHNAGQNQQHYSNPRGAMPPHGGNNHYYAPPQHHHGSRNTHTQEYNQQQYNNNNYNQPQQRYHDQAYHQQPSGRPPPQGQYNLHGRPIQNHGGRPPPQHHQQQQYDYGPRDGGYSHQSQSQQQIHNNLGYNGHEYSAHQHQQSTYYNEDGSNNNYGAKVSEGQYMNNGHHHQSYHKPPPMHASPGRTTTKKESTIGKLGNTYGGASDEDIQAVLSAARHGRVQEVGAYLDQGVPVNIRDKFGNTILAIACQNGLKKMAKLALRRGADINSRNYKGNTPLHFCFTYGYGDTLGKYLISKGADPAIKNHQGTTCYEGLGGGDNKKK